MTKRLFFAILPLAVLLALPLLLRPAGEVARPGGAEEKLVIITAHTEPVKYEFEVAFRAYYQQRYGVDLEIEYRSVGGSSDIVRYIADRYEAEFRRAYEKLPDAPPWSPKLAAAFSNHRLRPDSPAAEPEERAARQAFLASEVGIGIDLMWGGGTYEHHRQAERGFGVDAGVAARRPELLDPAVIPHSFGGEFFYDRQGRYYGSCLSSFGLCYNPDRLKQLAAAAPPDSWRSLGEPRFFNAVVLADPTKSGTATKCFEAILQQCMAEAVAVHGEEAGLAVGWAEGLNLIKRIVGNSRSLTDSAGKVPRDIASGNAAAGMAIDYYGLSEQQWSETLFAGSPKIFYVPPRGGTAVSPDPIQLLRGAPNGRAARAFIDFVLSEAGQKLWCYRVGVPGGPRKTALRRPPIRRDLYDTAHRPFLADPDYNPYEAGAHFTYRAAWTGPYFNLLRVLIRCIALDLDGELRASYRAILDAGGPERVPEAMAAFNHLTVPYAEAAAAAKRLQVGEDNSVLDVVVTCRRWSEEARRSYRRAAQLAKEGK